MRRAGRSAGALAAAAAAAGRAAARTALSLGQRHPVQEYFVVSSDSEEEDWYDAHLALALGQVEGPAGGKG